MRTCRHVCMCVCVCLCVISPSVFWYASAIFAYVLWYVRWLLSLFNGIPIFVGYLIPNPSLQKECPRGVMVKVMDCGIVISEFELQSRYYVHFRTNTLGKGMNPLILPAIG